MSFLQEFDAHDTSDDQGRAALIARWIATEPHAFFAELRERRPILRTSASTLVTTYRDVQDVLSQPDTFSVRLYGLHMDPCVGPFMLGRDLTDLNWREKSIMQTMLSIGDLDNIRRLSNAFAVSALVAAQDGKIEVVDTIGRALPIFIVANYFGYPGPSYETMKLWSKTSQAHFFKNVQNDPAVAAAAVQSGTEFRAYLREFIAARRSEIAANPVPATTVVDRLIQASLPPEVGLNDERLVSNLTGLLIGAVETTSQAIAQALREILKRPAVLQDALSVADTNPERFASIVWEALRFNPINPLVVRFVERDAVVAKGTTHETRVPGGTLVLACTSSAMLDGAEVPDADLFLVGRPSKHYFHFGVHHHECLGKYVGEVMVIEAVKVLLKAGASLLPGPEGQIDFKGGPFPESFVVGIKEVA